MPKFDVYGTVTIMLTVTVEAENAEEAVEKAYDAYGGLSDLTGNGRDHGALIGHNDENMTIEAGDDQPQFDRADPADD